MSPGSKAVRIRLCVLTFVGEVRGQNASSIGGQIVQAELFVVIGHNLQGPRIALGAVIFFKRALGTIQSSNECTATQVIVGNVVFVG